MLELADMSITAAVVNMFKRFKGKMVIIGEQIGERREIKTTLNNGQMDILELTSTLFKKF
jgi:hypothetical protein